jgi:hypothetical protein
VQGPESEPDASSRHEASLPSPRSTVRTTLKREQVERWRLGPGQDRETGVRLPAVVGLVDEQMRKDLAERLLVRGAAGGAVRDASAIGRR